MSMSTEIILIDKSKIFYEMYLNDLRECEGITKINKDNAWEEFGFEVDLSKLPKEVKRIRFLNIR